MESIHRCAHLRQFGVSKMQSSEESHPPAAEGDAIWIEALCIIMLKVPFSQLNRLSFSKSGLHWICSCCPRGQPHRWTATPHCRIGLDRGCPVCAGRQACVCNSLASLLPSVAAELDVEKNGFLPADITASSNKKVWWRNAKRGSWAQAVDHRTMHAIGRRRSYMP